MSFFVHLIILLEEICTCANSQPLFTTLLPDFDEPLTDEEFNFSAPLTTILGLGDLPESHELPRRLAEWFPQMTSPTPVAREDEPNCANDSVILSILLNETIYNRYRIPDPKGVDVRVEYWVQEITTVSEISREFELDIYINEMWRDPALQFDQHHPCKFNITLGYEVLDKIWIPNSCFINSKLALIHDSPFRNVFLMILSNGTVWVNYRAKIRGPCRIDLFKFPMDSQTCLLTYESFNYNLDQVKMRWMPMEAEKKPVWTLKNITLPDFQLKSINPVYQLKEKQAGKWVQLTVYFLFERRYVWYFLQAYIPTYLTIFVSWISFSLCAKAIPARTVLGVNALLALMLLFGNIMRRLPRVTYVKAIDVWLLACMTFVFMSLVELAVVGFLASKEPSPDNGSITVRQFYEAKMRRKEEGGKPHCFRFFALLEAENVDQISSVAFPAFFSLFNIVYWTYYSF